MMEGCRLAVTRLSNDDEQNRKREIKNQITSIVTVAHPLDAAANEFYCARKQFLKRKTKTDKKKRKKKRPKDCSFKDPGPPVGYFSFFFHRNDQVSQENTQRACSNRDQPN